MKLPIACILFSLMAVVDQVRAASFGEVDFFVSPKWYAVEKDKSNNGETIYFRMFAAPYIIKDEKMYPGLANILNFRCSRTGNWYSLDFPNFIKIQPFEGISDQDGVILKFIENEKEIKLLGRKRGNGVGIDSTGNQNEISKLTIDIFRDSTLIISVRGSYEATKLKSNENFLQNIDTLLKEVNVHFKTLSEDEMRSECSKFIRRR